MIGKRKMRGMTAAVILLSFVVIFAMTSISCKHSPDDETGSSPTKLEGGWESGSGKITFSGDSFTMPSSMLDDVNMDVKGTFSLSGTEHITFTINQFSLDGGVTWKTFDENNVLDAMVMAQSGMTEAQWNQFPNDQKQTMRNTFKMMFEMFGGNFSNMINETRTQTGTYSIADAENKLTLTFDDEEQVFYREGFLPPGTNRGSAVPLIMNQWKDGAITAFASEVWYSFPVLTGTTYYVWWNESGTDGDGSKTLDVRVTGYYGDDTISITGFNNTDSAWTTSKSFTPNQTGTVYLKVVPYTAGSTGTFGILYSTTNTRPGVPRPASTPLTADQWMDGDITAASGTVWYSFDVTAGITYYVWWNDSGSNAGDGFKTVNVRVTGYYNENEENITNFNAVDTAWTTPTSFTPGQDSTVYLRVAPYTSGNTGSFGIVYNTTNTRPDVPWVTPVGSTPLTIRQWEDGNISTANPIIWYTFNVTAGTTHYVWLNDSDASNGKTLDAVMTGYYEGNTTPLFNNVDIAWSTPQSFTPGEDSTVFLKVAPNSSGRTGTFGIAYNDANTRPPVSIATAPARPSTPTATVVPWGGIRVSWNSVNGAESYTVWRSTESTYTQIGTIEWDTFSYIDDTATDPDTTYYYKLSASNSNGVSDLSLASTGRAGTAKTTIIPLTEDTWADGDISSGGEQWFNFTATADTQYIYASFGTLDDLYVQLYDTNGTTVGSRTELWSNTISISRTVMIGQEYYIRITPYGSSDSGTYQIAFSTATPPSIPTNVNSTVWPTTGGIAVSWNSANGAEEYIVYRATSSTGEYTQVGTTETTIYIDDTATSTTTTYYYKVSAKNSIIESNQSSATTGRNGADAATVTPLTEGIWANGNIPSGSEQWFSFTATAATQYIHVNFGTLNDMYMQLYDADTSKPVGTQTEFRTSTTSASRSVTIGQEYYMRVWPYSTSYSGTYSIVYNADSTRPGVPPPAPNNLTSSAGPWEEGIKLSWGMVSAATEYIVYRATGSTGEYTQIGTTETNSYTDTTAAIGTMYYYKVASKNDAGGEGGQTSSNTSGMRQTAIPLTEDDWADGDIPSDGEQWFSFTATAPTQYIHANFGTLTNLYVQLYTATGTTFGIQTNLTSGTRYISRTVTSGQEYYIKVTPYSNNYSGTYQIAFGTIAPLPAPTNVSTAVVPWGGIRVSWNSVTGAEEYIVYRATTGGYTQVGTTETTGYLDDTATSTTTNYFYRVSAKNGKIEGNQSTATPGRNGTAVATVTPLTEGIWVDGNIPASSNGQQCFNFTATAATQYIHVSSGTLTNRNVQLYDATGATVGAYSSNNTISRDVTIGQEYYIRVYPINASFSGTYQIAFNASATAPVQ